MNNRDLLERIARDVSPPGFPELLERRNLKARRAKATALVVGLAFTVVLVTGAYQALMIGETREPSAGGQLSRIDGPISFTVNESDGWHVGTVNPDGSGRRVLTDGVRDYSTSWSPDGSQIAYDTDQGGIWIMNADGSGKLRLTTGSDSYPRWSPDGARILFSRYGNGMFEADRYTSYPTMHLWIVNVDGSNEHQVTNERSADIAGSWSPDGGKIAFIRSDANGSGVWVSGLDGRTGLRKVVSLPFQLDGTAAWSPDGRQILYLVEGYNDGNSEPRIWMVDVDGSNAHMVIDEWARDPAWSPDGAEIAYTNGDIWVVDADGSNPRQITSDPAEELQPSWGHAPATSTDPRRDGTPPTATIPASQPAQPS
jgi:Tol biopolymer transport system component